MKHMKKWLALLLAGMMVTASLFACSDNNGGSDGDEDEDKAKETEKSFDQYKKLSPEEVFEAMEDAEQFTFKFVENQDGDESTLIFERDGDAVELKQDDSTMFFDTENCICYEEIGEDEYDVEEDSYQWDSLFEELIEECVGDYGLNFIMSDDSYEKDGSTYTLTEDAIEDYIAANSFITEMEGSMKRSSTEYVFTVRAENEDGEETELEYTVTFEETSVKLPKVEGDASNQDDTTTAPVTTETPQVPEVPDVLDENDLVRGMLTPQELDEELSDVGKLSMVATSYNEDTDSRILLEMTKYYDYIELSQTVHGNQQLAYYDFDEKLEYAQIDGVWYKSDENADEMNWESLYEWLSEDIWVGILSASLDEFDYDDAVYKLTMKSDAVENYDGLGSASITYYPSLDSYYFELRNASDTTEVTVSLSFDAEKVELPDALDYTDEPEVPVDPTADYLAPSELYTALRTREDVSIYVESGGTTVRFDKDGGVIAVYMGTTADDLVLSYYVDFDNQSAYIESEGQWVRTNDLSGLGYTSWEEMLDTMNITADNPVFIDSSYESFSESDSILYAAGNDESTLTRDTDEYYLSAIDSDGNETVIAFYFGEQVIVLPEAAI